MVRHYLLRQPKQLECLAMDKLAAWNALQAQNLMSPISKLHQHDATKAEAALSRQIVIIRNYLDCNTPRVLHDTLVTKTIKELYRIFNKTKPSLKRLSNSLPNIIGRMIEILFTENLTFISLNFYQFTLFRDSLRYKSHLLTGLINLDLNFDTTAKSDVKNIDTDVVQLLQELHSLKYLTIKYICTDNILKCIIKNCKLIEELNVYSSIEINDKSVDILTQLHNLRSINLDKTSVRHKGIQTLLLSCKNIEHIVIPQKSDHTDGLPYILQQIEKSEQNFPKLFKIKTLRNDGEALEELQLAFRMCPLIQSLHIHMNRTARSNIMAITDLKYIRELTLEAYYFYNDKVKAALQVIGSNLVHLHLLLVKQIDLNALINISTMSPNLQSLTLENCTFVTSQCSFQELSERRFENPLFTNLIKLTLDMKDSFDSDKPTRWWHKPAVFLLSNCLNVEIIECSIRTWLDQDVMLQVLDKNPLTYLKQFKIVQSYDSTQTMTSLVIDRIIQNSINYPEVIQKGIFNDGNSI